MKIVLDIETDSLTPKVIWCVVTKDIDTEDVRVFTEPDKLRKYLDQGVDLCIAHNGIDFDLHVLDKLWGIRIPRSVVKDTLVLSRLANFKIEGGHSLDAWGVRLKFPKMKFDAYHEFSAEMVEYCIQDVQLTHELWKWMTKKFHNPSWKTSIELEHDMAWFCRDCKTNGFAFNIAEALKLYAEIRGMVDSMDREIKNEFKPKKKLDKSFKIRYTIKGKLVKAQQLMIDEMAKGSDLYEIRGDQILRYKWEEFNPESSKQICERLAKHWQPIEKTAAHIKAIEEKDYEKLKTFAVTGWKISETNLGTLKDDAPKSARLLVKRIMLGSRLRQLVTWIEAYDGTTGSIHSNLNGIGTWTHRLSSTNPNLQNIAAEKTIKYKTAELRELAINYGGRFRALFTAHPGRILVGTDMEGAHLRLFAHFINDEKFIQALVSGDKKFGTDPHSLNKQIIGDLCTDRDLSKTFIFTFLNGGGVGKVSEIFRCSVHEARKILDDFISAYPGLKTLKDTEHPKVAEQGFFVGLDERKVLCDSAHLAMAGSLQNGEKVCMALTMKIWRKKLDELNIPYWPINCVHDEFQTETLPEYADKVAEVQCWAFEEAGKQLGLLCPLAGESSIGYNWLETH